MDTKLCVCLDMKARRELSLLKYQPAVCSLSLESCRPPQTLTCRGKLQTGEDQQLKPLLQHQVTHCLLRVFVRGEEDEKEEREGARAKPEPGRLQLATDHKAYEALQACPVNKAIVPTRSAEHNTTRGPEPRL